MGWQKCSGIKRSYLDYCRIFSTTIRAEKR